MVIRSQGIWFGIVLGTFMVQLAMAGSVSVPVRATVLPWVRTQIEQRIFDYQVSPQNLRDGFVDLHAAISFRCASNSAGTLSLAFTSLETVLISILQQGEPQAALRIVFAPNLEAPPQSIDLRLFLPKDQEVGRHLLHLTALPFVAH